MVFDCNLIIKLNFVKKKKLQQSTNERQEYLLMHCLTYVAYVLKW